ncbi:MAG: type II toxin-antitoxin system Phd/YefM family antitoxin [Planctomycetota bacterium]
MIEFHPEFLKKDGKNEFVVLPYDEFLAIQDLLSDAEDLIELRQAKAEEGDAPTVSLAEVRRKFGLED